MGPARLDPEDRAQPAPLEHRHQHAEGGADREQVHGRGGQRDEQAAEDDHQQQEREHDHQSDEQGELVAEHSGEVDEDGRVPAHVDGHPGTGHHCGDGHLSEVIDQLGGGGGLGRGRRVHGEQGHLLAVLFGQGQGDHVAWPRRAVAPPRSASLVSTGWSAGPEFSVTSSSGPLKPGPKPLASRS